MLQLPHVMWWIFSENLSLEHLLKQKLRNLETYHISNCSCNCHTIRCVSSSYSDVQFHVSTFSKFNTLRPRQNGRHFPDDILKWIFLNENVWISIEISLKFVPKCQINNILALVQIMAWRRPGEKPLSESIMVSLLTHICVTPPQWVK